MTLASLLAFYKDQRVFVLLPPPTTALLATYALEVSELLESAGLHPLRADQVKTPALWVGVCDALLVGTDYEDPAQGPEGAALLACAAALVLPVHSLRLRQ